MTDFIDAYQSFADDFDGLPEEKFPLRPEVLALAEVSNAVAKSNTRISPAVPQLEVDFKIVESATSSDGQQAKGTIKAWLDMPPAGHSGYKSEKALNFHRAQFRKALVAMLAPEAKGKDAENSIVGSEARAAGGYDKAIIGKRVIIKIGVNDGTNKEGEVVNTKRHEDPRNQVDNYIPATAGNIEKYIKATVHTAPL